MHILASFDSLVGTFWFILLEGIVCYIAGNVLPFGKLLQLLKLKD